MLFDGAIVCILTKVILVGEYLCFSPSEFLINYKSIDIHLQVNVTTQRATSTVFFTNCPTAFHLDPQANEESEESKENRAFKVHKVSTSCVLVIYAHSCTQSMY